MGGAVQRGWPRLTLFLVLTIGCGGAPSVPPAGQAERFITALNAADTVTLLALTDDPFLFREQRWVSASDGSGFVLGPAQDSLIRGPEARRRFLAQLATRVHVRDSVAVARPPARETLLANELAGGAERWTQLQLFVFLRGMADVEHTAITGVDEKNGRVAAFYVN